MELAVLFRVRSLDKLSCSNILQACNVIILKDSRCLSGLFIGAQNMTQPKTLLAVLAHPDDETFGLGGTLALYARRGCDTYLVCATGGEAGTVDPQHLDGYKDTAELRADELKRAAQILGLKRSEERRVGKECRSRWSAY